MFHQSLCDYMLLMCKLVFGYWLYDYMFHCGYYQCLLSLIVLIIMWLFVSLISLSVFRPWLCYYVSRKLPLICSQKTRNLQYYSNSLFKEFQWLILKAGVLGYPTVFTLTPLLLLTIVSTGSHLDVYCKRVLRKYVAKFTGKHLLWSFNHNQHFSE